MNSNSKTFYATFKHPQLGISISVHSPSLISPNVAVVTKVTPYNEGADEGLRRGGVNPSQTTMRRCVRRRRTRQGRRSRYGRPARPACTPNVRPRSDGSEPRAADGRRGGRDRSFGAVMSSVAVSINGENVRGYDELVARLPGTQRRLTLKFRRPVRGHRVEPDLPQGPQPASRGPEAVRSPPERVGRARGAVFCGLFQVEVRLQHADVEKDLRRRSGGFRIVLGQREAAELLGEGVDIAGGTRRTKDVGPEGTEVYAERTRDVADVRVFEASRRRG